MAESPIPKETALRICDQIRTGNRSRRLSVGGLWCWGCERFSGGDPAKLCISNRPDFRGCGQVNSRYDRPTTA